MARLVSPPAGVRFSGRLDNDAAALLGPETLAFVADLHRRFDAVRRERLRDRELAQAAWDAGRRPGFLDETRPLRASDWTVRPAPPDLADRRVEITGPVDRKMMINALNSGANVFMADFEDALSPTWRNVVQGQMNLRDAAQGWLTLKTPDGRLYKVGPHPAVLMVRPRGWHLVERHVAIDGRPVSASLFDAGVFLFLNAACLLRKGTGPYLYLPKLEHHLEARLWDQVLAYAEKAIGIPAGSVRVTVLVETLPAAFQMDEILWALRDRAVGLNAGRWDYLFSAIKRLRAHPDAVLPDRSAVTMEAPFLRAYAQLLVSTCHRRGAHAMGGMSAFVPSRRDPEATERALAKVREDKDREAAAGHDGTWVAHPDLVAVAREAFDRALGRRPNQLGREAAPPPAEALLDFQVPGAAVTEGGVRHNLRSALLYIESWLRGVGAVAIDDLMEDAATAEISRSQLWQWIRHGARLDDGRRVTVDLCERLLQEETARAVAEAPDPGRRRFGTAGELLRHACFHATFPEFLTLAAYEHLETLP